MAKKRAALLNANSVPPGALQPDSVDADNYVDDSIAKQKLDPTLRAEIDGAGLDQAAVDARILNRLMTVSQAEAEAGIGVIRRAWTAQRVKQAVEALSSRLTADQLHLLSLITGIDAKTKSIEVLNNRSWNPASLTDPVRIAALTGRPNTSQLAATTFDRVSIQYTLSKLPNYIVAQIPVADSRQEFRINVIAGGFPHPVNGSLFERINADNTWAYYGYKVATQFNSTLRIERLSSDPPFDRWDGEVKIDTSGFSKNLNPTGNTLKQVLSQVDQNSFGDGRVIGGGYNHELTHLSLEMSQGLDPVQITNRVNRFFFQTVAGEDIDVPVGGLKGVYLNGNFPANRTKTA